MVSAAIKRRRQDAAKRSVERRLRQLYINENIDKPGRFEGMYKKPTLIRRSG